MNYSYSSSSSIFCNHSSSISLSSYNTIFFWGLCYFGSKDSINYHSLYPKQLLSLSNIKIISYGEYHGIYLDYNGNVYSFGKNNVGQLGIGKDNIICKYSYIPHQINLSFIKQISCGNDFTICLSEEGKLFSFGNNFFGQLGLDNYDDYNSPQLIKSLNNIVFIECSSYSSICISNDNEYYSWGRNSYGQLGNENIGGTISLPNNNTNWPNNIINIKSGYYHSLLLTEEGYVYSFGRNNYGQLGINDENIEFKCIPFLISDIPEIQRIECGSYHSMCIDINNNLWIFGNNNYGQLGLGNKENTYKPIIHPTLSNIIDISSGGMHTFVKTIDNKIYAFGHNKYSQLGIKTSEREQLTPIQVFIDKEDIWSPVKRKSRAKSARK